MTGSYFPLLDMRPALGRLIRAEEGAPGRTDAVVVLGHSTWQRRFGGDRAVVGRIIRVNGQPCTIVGVAPPSFAGTFAFSESELYLPLNWSGGGDFDDRRWDGLHAIARTRPNVPMERAQAAMNVVAERLARQYPDANRNIAVRVLPERFARPEEDQFRSNVLGASTMLALAGIVMIVATVNVTHLLLAQATGRRHELAVRAALGAGRGRLVRQMLTESLMLAALGGGAGVLLAAWVAQVIATIRLPGDLPVRFDFHLDVRVLAYALAVVLVTGLFVGLLPALRASRENMDQALRRSRYGSLGYRRRIGGALVAGQVASCFVVLVAAGLFVRSLFEAERADLGFRPAGVLNLHMDVGQLGYAEAQGRACFDDIKERVRSVPGVRDVSFAFTIPMGYVRVSATVEAGRQAAGQTEDLSAGTNMVDTDYFRTMGIPILRGRGFSAADSEQSARVAVVNERLAGMLWPGRDPLGLRFRSRAPNAPWVEVVGVTGTGKYAFLFEDPQPYFYVPITQAYTGLRVLHVRTGPRPEVLAPAIEWAIREREPNLPLYDVQSMTRALGGGLGLFLVRVAAAAAAAFGLLGLALATVGVYGVVSYTTSQRTHEMGVRLALGAARQDILRLVLRGGVNMLAVGLGAGLFIALAFSRLLGTFLFGVSARDPLTFVGVAAVLTSVAVCACMIPAWRAGRIDPAVTLRAE